MSDIQSASETIRRRDRQIGLGIHRRKTNLAALRHWIRVVRTGRDGQGQQVQRGLTILITCLWLLGLILGWFIGGVVFRYDGNVPVNIIHALIILVGSQLLFLFVLLFMLIFCLARLRETLSFINPAFWLSNLMAHIKPEWRPLFRELLSTRGTLERHGIRQWLMIYLAQHFTVALNLGIIAIYFYLITVTDLAFGWNTTLDVNMQTVSGIFSALSKPWQWVLPMAAPDMELIAGSRYFRLQGLPQEDIANAAELGTWWMFMLMCFLVYGLMPRILLLLFSGVRYDRALTSAILGSTGVSQLLSRMHEPQVFSSAPVQHHEDNNVDCRKLLQRRQSDRAISTIVIEWSKATSQQRLLTRAGFQIEQVFPAGGNQDINTDRELINTVVKYTPGAVVIVMASWEPPMMEFIDFLKVLREKMDKSALRIVFLIPMEQRGTVSLKDLEQWESTLHALDDTNLYVETP